MTYKALPILYSIVGIVLILIIILTPVLTLAHKEYYQQNGITIQFNCPLH